VQGFTKQHGYEMLMDMDDAGVRTRYEAAMRRVQTAVETLARGSEPEAEENSQYAIPLAFRKRALFKMDFAEAVYISELRTTPAGHVSYRNVAYAMYEEVARKYLVVAKYFGVDEVESGVDVLYMYRIILIRLFFASICMYNPARLILQFTRSLIPMADERGKAIDLAVSQIEKQFGKGSIMRLGSKEAIVPISVIPTGSISFDAALGVG